jgi:hypothetical protein
LASLSVVEGAWFRHDTGVVHHFRIAGVPVEVVSF